jgi:hypothetical protein
MALALPSIDPLQEPGPPGFKPAFTLLRDLGPGRKRMSIRNDFDAIERAAGEACPGASRILGGLLLLIAP